MTLHGHEQGTSEELGEGVAILRLTTGLSPADILKAYAGDYKLTESGNTVSVTFHDGRLFIGLPRKFPSELFAESATRFFLKTVDYEITFVADANGRPIRMYISTASKPHEAQRAETLPTNSERQHP